MISVCAFFRMKTCDRCVGIEGTSKSLCVLKIQIILWEQAARHYGDPPPSTRRPEHLPPPAPAPTSPVRLGIAKFEFCIYRLDNLSISGLAQVIYCYSLIAQTMFEPFV